MCDSKKLSEEELFNIFKSLQVPIRMSDLRTPTKECVISVFDAFLRDLQINLASPILRPFESISHLENPELTEESRNYILLAATMNRFLKDVTVTISDIVAPKPKKTKKIFNYLVVFWSYALKQMGLFSQVSNAHEADERKAEEIKIESLNLDSEIQDCQEKLNSMTTSKEELLEVVSVRQKIIKNYTETQQKKVQEYQQQKETETQLRTEKVNMELNIATIKEKISELDQVILSSPEKIKTDVQKLKDMIKDVEEKILVKEQEKKEKKKMNQKNLSELEELIKNKSKLQKMQNEVQSLMENLQALTAVCEKCQEVNKELKELQSAQETKVVMKHFYEEKLTNIQRLKNQQIEEIMKTFEMLQRQLSEETQHCHGLASSIAKLEKEIDNEVDSVVSIVNRNKEAEKETKQYKAQYKQQMLAMNNQFKEGCKEVSERAKSVFKCL